jgi:hypothetical protein
VRRGEEATGGSAGVRVFCGKWRVNLVEATKARDDGGARFPILGLSSPNTEHCFPVHCDDMIDSNPSEHPTLTILSQDARRVENRPQ